MMPSQIRRLEVNINLLRGIVQNLDSLHLESGDPCVRRAADSLVRALEQLAEIDERKVA